MRNLLSVLLLLAVMLGACASPSTPIALSPPSSTATLPPGESTFVEDVAAQPSPTPLPSATLAPTAIPTATQPNPTATAEPTTTPTCRDQAEFVRDLSFSSGSHVEVGTYFAKLWRVQNSGTCTWDSKYVLEFVSGESFGLAASTTLPQEVPPGESIDLRLTLLAPLTAGDYTGAWQIVNPQGEPVVISPSSGSSLSVDLVVVPVTPKKVRPEDCG